ncbi:jg13106 [Pararge aegeria aegeria]|uniref:Jg13106 protein n=2 Tax=Pararge aegeria TaxID=116150 RepID=A0A8S4R8D1_9NEOP|nr:jg13106 [Pararge aegeria aegeria]
MRHNRRRRQPRYNDRHNNYGDNSIKQRKYYDRRDDLNDYEQERDYSRRNYLQRRDYDPRDEDNVSEQRTDYGRRDDYRRQSETFSKILDKLDEILFYMKMSQTLPPPSPPPPPPQVIFINVPHCNDNTIQTETETETRFLGRNWGKVVSDGSRPINFNIIKSDEPPVIPPPVEHGTIQAGISPVPTSSDLGPCKAATLVCCQYPRNQIEECFTLYGCEELYNKDNRDSCDAKVVEDVVRKFAKAYAPINKQ